MKNHIISVFAAVAVLTGCVDLNLNPLSEGSSENWYSTDQEIELSLNGLYRPALWKNECTRLFNTDRWTDDWSQRTQLYDWVGGTISSTWSQGAGEWTNHFKGVARANTILYSMDKAKDLTPAKIAQYTAEAKFLRACFYMYLIANFGDVPFYTDYITLEEAYELGRTDREVVLKQIYKDFDEAAADLPVSYSGNQTKRATKGAAYAMKARAALLMNDWATCAEAAKNCMDLGVYKLHPDYGEYFKSSTKVSDETIFALYTSNDLGVHSYDEAATRSFYPRNNGGTSVAQPAWDLIFAFPCTDGKMVWESPLYDPADIFKNRDPRLSEVVAPFDEEFMDYIYNPRPSAATTLQVSTGLMVKNNDTKPVSKDCSYNGFVLKKFVDEEWIDDRLTDTPQRIMRYADVLLMFAEAKLELGQIDAELFNAINQVRARAYKCSVSETTKYPAITETTPSALRKIIRNERRIELCWENRRWFDLIRWRCCESVLGPGTYVYGLPSIAESQANEATGYWPFPKDFRPSMRPDSSIDMSGIEAYPGWYTREVERGFSKRQYLYPIPINERTICPLLTQNPGY
ncbi:MAG: RagB/SusD family nutrient uptake outer membrane protein [Bacteroidales bacterium]|nr:RagB/SusD family nutrient uptake outer membrane protein [Bacteroidales bacterium]